MDATHRAYSRIVLRRSAGAGQRDGSEPNAVSRRHDQYAPPIRIRVASAIEARHASPERFARHRPRRVSGVDRIAGSLRPRVAVLDAQRRRRGSG